MGDSSAAAIPLGGAGFSVSDVKLSGFSLVQRDVTDFSRHSAGSAVQTSSEDQTGAESRAECKKDNIFCAYPGAVTPFRKRTGIRVVTEVCRTAETLSQHIRNRNVVPAGQIRRRLNDTALTVERTSAAYADCACLGCNKFFNSFEQTRQSFFAVRGLKPDFLVYPGPGTSHTSTCCAAYIETDKFFFLFFHMYFKRCGGSVPPAPP